MTFTKILCSLLNGRLGKVLTPSRHTTRRPDTDTASATGLSSPPLSRLEVKATRPLRRTTTQLFEDDGQQPSKRVLAKIINRNYGDLKIAAFRVYDIDKFESADGFHFDGIRRGVSLNYIKHTMRLTKIDSQYFRCAPGKKKVVKGDECCGYQNLKCAKRRWNNKEIWPRP